MSCSRHKRRAEAGPRRSPRSPPMGIGRRHARTSRRRAISTSLRPCSPGRRRAERWTTSTPGGGENEAGGTRPTTRRSKRAPRHAARNDEGTSAHKRRAAPHSRSTSALCRRARGSSNRARTSPPVAEKGGFDTTLKQRRGQARASRSPSTTVTWGKSSKRLRNLAASRASRSTATTRAPVRARRAVSAPAPAPRSSTSSPR
jgi:hypothetical protein